MAKDETLESKDNIIDLVDIVQPSDKSKGQDFEKVDFDTQLSDILSNGEPISLEDIPDLDELFSEDFEEEGKETNSQQIDLDNEDILEEISKGEESIGTASLNKIDSEPEDLDALLDNLFSEEEKDPIKNQKQPVDLTLEQLEFSTNKDKTNFLEKALNGLDDLDDLLMEEDLDLIIDTSPKQVVGVVEQDSSERVQDIDTLLSDKSIEDVTNVENILSDKNEVEAILDAVKEPAFLDEEMSLLDSNVSQISSTASYIDSAISPDKIVKVIEPNELIPSVSNELLGELSTKVQQLESEVQDLKQRMSALELIIMDQESEVETLQDSNIVHFKAIEEKINNLLQMDTLVKGVVDKLQPEIDKFAAEAAIRIIQEEIDAMLKK